MRIMIADDSAVVRTIITQGFAKNKDLNIIASVSTCQKLLNNITVENPDVIICGNETSDETEKEALDTIVNKFNIPVLLLESSAENPGPFIGKLTEKIQKPKLREYNHDFFERLTQKLNSLLELKPLSNSKNKNADKIFRLLCIGASTGGPTAVSEVLSGLGNNFPLPILYTQHIEIGKDQALVDWLNQVCRNVKIKLAEDGEEAKAGVVYMAPADRHLVISHESNFGKPVLKISDEEPERYLRPAVNKLFNSAAKIYKDNVLAVLLTGMGADGANGCKKICENGGWTIVEDKSTCAVFGMPAAAIDLGAAKEVLPRPEISKRILELVKR
ncbi:chemotaxis protein CheB [Treponema bryantii]|uniref:chemotaxis protein CheB n=1 Tax=Treponema bryantii TaxID=163 RepID=UPI0003B33258|nr:chemotaxis protein CheB [Treponema bryantii]